MPVGRIWQGVGVNNPPELATPADGGPGDAEQPRGGPVGGVFALALPPESVVRDVARRASGGVVVCLAALIFGYWLFVRTRIGQQIDDLAYDGRLALGGRYVRLDDVLLDWISVAVVAVAALLLVAIGVARGCRWRGLLAAGAFGGAIVAAELMKHVLLRPLLFVDPGVATSLLSRETYPSGHTTITTSFVLAVLLVCPSRRRPWMAVLAGVVSAAYATGVLFAGWHRPSDALGGLALSGAALGCAAALVAWIERGRAWSVGAGAVSFRSQILVATGLFVVMVGAAWAVAARDIDAFPDYDLPFLALVPMIVIGSFAVTLWYGWVIRQLR